MKKLLLLSLLISIAVQINGQQLSDLENEHQKLTKESEKLRKDKSVSVRDVFKQDSTYYYDDFEDNLEGKFIYNDYNFANNYASYDFFTLEDMQWTHDFLRNQEFNSDGSVSSYIGERYQNGGWINSSKGRFEYNASGYETFENRETWDVDLQEWIPSYQIETTYNSENTLLTLSQYGRDITTGELELRYTNTYTNVDNVITEWLTENFNDGIMYSTSKTEVYLNADNDRDSTYSFDWNVTTSTWDLVSRYVYPEDINATIRTYQTDQYLAMTDSWDPLYRTVLSDYTDIDEIQYSDRFRSNEGLSEFYLTTRLEYFWSNNPLDVEITSLNEIDILMPNPFEGNPQITVNGVDEQTTFVIYDFHGNTMFKKYLNQSNSFSLDKILPNGIYFLNLIQANNVVDVKKIVKIQ